MFGMGTGVASSQKPPESYPAGAMVRARRAEYLKGPSSEPTEVGMHSLIERPLDPDRIPCGT